MAERAGVSQRSLSDTERGAQGVPRPDPVTLLVPALDLSRSERDVFEGLVERCRRLRPMPDQTAIHQAPLITERVFERPKHNLPRSLTSPVGRERELAELAVAHARVLPVEQLAHRLGHDSEVLRRAIRMGLPQRQTLRATLVWSHQLLGEPERAVMRRLSVSARGWTLPLAEVVCSGAGINAADVLCLLTRLVDKAMVLVDASGAIGRYRLLEPIHHSALERLDASSEVTRYWARHAAACQYFAQIGEAAPVEPSEPSEISSQDQLETEHADGRIGLRCAPINQESRSCAAVHINVGPFLGGTQPPSGRKCVGATDVGVQRRWPGRVPRLRAQRADGTLLSSAHIDSGPSRAPG